MRADHEEVAAVLAPRGEYLLIRHARHHPLPDGPARRGRFGGQVGKGAPRALRFSTRQHVEQDHVGSELKPARGSANYGVPSRRPGKVMGNGTCRSLARKDRAENVIPAQAVRERIGSASSMRR
jgi:hypothetical protein